MSWQTETTVTDEQVRFYREKGYLTFGRLFTEEELEELRAYVDGLIAALPPERRPESLDVPHFEHPFLFRFLAHPRVLDVIERFVGPDIVLWSSHFISKREDDGLAVPWHQDGVYWGDRLDPMEVITMWLAVDESRVDNGCMRVVAGSHRRRGLRYEAVQEEGYLFGREVEAGEIDAADVVDLELAAGECHFHDAFTLHASNANRSARRRCGYTMRYCPAHVRHADNDDRPGRHRIYLVRGRDRTGGHNLYTPVPAMEQRPA